jgi:hypothetical protein
VIEHVHAISEDKLQPVLSLTSLPSSSKSGSVHTLRYPDKYRISQSGSIVSLPTRTSTP